MEMPRYYSVILMGVEPENQLILLSLFRRKNSFIRYTLVIYCEQTVID
jgi:hypothetical protein